MRETVIEAYLAERVGEHGGVAVKLGIGGGWPDRLVILPGGRIGLCELKRPGETPTPRQLSRLALLQRLGCCARWCSTFGQVATFVEDVASRRGGER